MLRRAVLDIYIEANEFKVYQPRTKVVKDERSDLLVEPHSINRCKNNLCNLLNSGLQCTVLTFFLNRLQSSDGDRWIWWLQTPSANLSWRWLWLGTNNARGRPSFFFLNRFGAVNWRQSIPWPIKPPWSRETVFQFNLKDNFSTFILHVCVVIKFLIVYVFC